METGREDFAAVLRAAQRRETKAFCTWNSVLICLSIKRRDLPKGHLLHLLPASESPQQRAGCASRAGRALSGRIRGPWPPFPAHIALCRSLCSRMVVPAAICGRSAVWRHSRSLRCSSEDRRSSGPIRALQEAHAGAV